MLNYLIAKVQRHPNSSIRKSTLSQLVCDCQKYTFKIFAVASVLPNGGLFPVDVVFTCEVWADKSIGMIEYGQKLYSFWLQSNPLGNAIDGWTFDWHIEKV